MNWDRIDAVFDRIRTNRKHFDMSTFISGRFGLDDDTEYCGTTMCIAGFATIAAGNKFVFREKWGDLYPDFVDANGDSVDPQEFGAKYLGFNFNQEHRIFYMTLSDDPDELYRYIKFVEATPDRNDYQDEEAILEHYAGDLDAFLASEGF